MNAHQASDLAQMQSLPLEAKIRMTKERIKVWYESWTRFEIYDKATGKTRFVTIDTRDALAEPPLKDTEYIEAALPGQVYVSFSGGKDSTVVADLCAQVCKRYGYTLYLLFVNTGLEYPEIQKFVKVFAEWLRKTYGIEVVLDIVRPEMRFDEVIKKYGYPVFSKEIALNIEYGRKSLAKGDEEKVQRYLYGVRKNPRTGETYTHMPLSKQALDFALNSEIPASNACCSVMKKKPADAYAKRTGRKSIQGVLAAESKLRSDVWIKHGCNAFNSKKPVSRPISFWTEQDVLHYLKKYDVPYCSVYGDIQVKPASPEAVPENQINMIDYLGCYEPEDTLETTGRDRTGCIFCMFGCHLEKEPNRFQKLKETHPRQYQYCIGGGEYVEGKWQPSKEGLGLAKVLDYIGVKYE